LRVLLRPVRHDDEPALRRIFSDPSVAQWWGDPDRSVHDVLNLDEDESGFMIEAGSQPVGYIQCYENSDPMYRSAGIDLAMHGDWQGQGLGPDAIRTLARHLVRDRGHHRLTIDPAAQNIRAIKAYEKVGFKPVGVMRQYELGPSGEWHDGLLMEMLAAELRD
jgi:aminoglycoside 6'-N-acetyltransferase